MSGAGLAWDDRPAAGGRLGTGTGRGGAAFGGAVARVAGPAGGVAGCCVAGAHLATAEGASGAGR